MDWTESFDWTEPRRDTYPDCGLATSFQMLCELAQINVDRADAHSRRPNGTRFRTADLARTFMVFRVHPLNAGKHRIG
jgi:hypothetical protein